MSRAEFRNALSSFLARLHDGHTYMERDQGQRDQGATRTLPIRLTIASDGLLIRNAVKGKEDLVGSRIVAINGEGIPAILKRVQEVASCENPYGAYFHLKEGLSGERRLDSIFPSANPKCRLDVVNPEGEQFSREMTWLPVGENGNADLEQRRECRGRRWWGWRVSLPVPGAPKGGCLFHSPRNVLARGYRGHREVEASLPGGVGRQILSRYYPNLKPPYDQRRELAKIPYLTETFRRMLIEMKEAGSSTLILDLRDNRGGYSFVAIPLLYMLYGDDYFGTPTQAYDVLVLSELYLAKNSVSLDDYNKRNGTDHRIGDYILSMDKDDRDSERTAEENRELHLKFLKENEFHCLKFVEDLNGQAVYTPKSVVVLTSPGTNSAAFTLCFYLWEMDKGVKFVGVPPRQSGNGPIESTPFVLPGSGLKGSISNHYQMSFPGDPERGRIFQPDYSLSWKDFQQYHFSQDAEILFAVDLVRGGSLGDNR